MGWLIDFCNNVTKMFNYLFRLMSTPISGVSDILGTDVTFLGLLSFLLIDYILAMFVLRIVRG